MQKHFTIESYKVKQDEIHVITEKDGITIPVYIPKDKFEMWLTEQKKTEFTKEDLYNYIIGNPITFRGVVMTDSVQSLLTQFELAHLKKVK